MSTVVKIGSILVAAFLVTIVTSPAWAGDKESYEEKVGVNDGTIAIIAGVIIVVCPMIAPKGSAICKESDPVKKAVALAQHIEDEGEVQHAAAAEQFYDAVEQFKQHYPLRAKAKDFAAKGDWKNAFGYEEFAWQYLVKTASKGINALKMASGQ